MEMMRIRILVYVCAFMSCEVQTASVKDSSEQIALQEALLLVELLKSEYSRVLRGNSFVKEGQVEEKDTQTCATTTVPTNAVTHKQTDKPVQQTEQSSTKQTLKPYTIPGSNRSYNHSYRAGNRRWHERRYPQSRSYYYDFPRRRFNAYRDYGSYGPAESWRRMDYDNIFGPQPGQANSTVSQPTTVENSSSEPLTLSSIITAAPTTVSEISFSSLPQTSSTSTIHSSTTVSTSMNNPVTPSETTLKPNQTSLPSSLSSIAPRILKSSTTPSTTHIIKKQTITSKSITSDPSAVNTVTNKNTQTKNPSVSKSVKHIQKKLSLSVKNTPVTSTNDPEQAQVAAELENELGASIEPSTALSSSRRWSFTWRPSTRVHLARSTPYHLPLPENHAFCYTNPESALCRTFIK